MALAKFIVVATPGEIPEICSIIANDVDVGPSSADKCFKFAINTGGVAMVFLNHNVVTCCWVCLPGVLRMNVTPGRAMKDQSNRWIFDFKYEQPPGSTNGFTIAEKTRNGNPFSV